MDCWVIDSVGRGDVGLKFLKMGKTVSTMVIRYTWIYRG